MIRLREVTSFFKILPLEQARELRLIVQKREITFQQPRQFLRRIAPQLYRVEFDRLDAPLHFDERRLKQRVLAPEIMVNHPLVHLGQIDDRLDRHRVKPLLRKPLDGCPKEAAARAVGIAGNRRSQNHVTPDRAENIADESANPVLTPAGQSTRRRHSA